MVRKVPLRAILSAQDYPRRRNAMNQQLLESIEREVLGWPGVEKDPDGSQVVLYRFGRRQIGHVHRDGVADFPFPKAVHDELISDGLAEPHRDRKSVV